MQIDVFSDTVCPWCRIGKRHLELALATLTSAEAASSHHAAAHRSPGARQSSVSTSEKADA